MMVESFADDLSAAVRYALETTRATAECPFHMGVVIRVVRGPARSCPGPCSRFLPLAQAAAMTLFASAL